MNPISTETAATNYTHSRVLSSPYSPTANSTKTQPAHPSLKQEQMAANTQHSISFYLFHFHLLLLLLPMAAPQSNLCRTSCGSIPIRYPFGIDDGCGSPYYRYLLLCANSTTLLLRTPSGRYPVRSISYADPHLVLSDPSMWSCPDGVRFRPAKPLALDTSVRFSLSPSNDYLFFDCDPRRVIAEPKTGLCDRFPDRCGASCDTSSYLCRNLPDCPSALSERVSCCSYYPRASESLRLMLEHCASYTSVYWKTVGPSRPYDQVPEYGIRVNFEFPVTTTCFQCQDYTKGGGTCGFDALSQNFLCLCSEGNVTTYCTDGDFNTRHRRRVGVVAGTTALSVAAAVGVGAGVWYWKRLRPKRVVTCGLQTNENRLF